MSDKLKGLGLFAAGAAIGGAVALLYAPRAGRHTRARIRNSANQTLHRAEEVRDGVRTYVSELVDDVSEAIAPTIESCKKTATVSSDTVLQALDKVRERMDNGRERVENFFRSVAS